LRRDARNAVGARRTPLTTSGAPKIEPASAAEGAAEAPGYPLLSAFIRTGCRLAIRISEKI
jgi:hypothetical protein